MAALFIKKTFFSHSGRLLDFKIECDSLTEEDIATLAYLGGKLLFKKVVGVPTGGLRLAKALEQYCVDNPNLPVLIVDDVLTTGRSMEEMRAKINDDTIGLVIFARQACPSWIQSIFEMRM